MRKLIVLILVFIVLQNLFAQSGWQWQNPLPQGNILWDVKFYNSNIGIAAGGAGTIIKTTNGGINWTTTYARFDSSGVPLSYRKICIADTSVIYLYGLYSPMYLNPTKLIKSSNGGVNWFVIPKPAGVNDMYFINANTGFLVSGGIYKTTNGGMNWANSFQTGDGAYSIKFVNEQTGFVAFKHYGATYNQYIMKTTNQGLNWYQTYFNLRGEIHDINFISGQTGYAYSAYNNCILKTTNFGESWDSLRATPTGDYSSRFSFFSNGTGYLSTEDIYNQIFYKTTNEGLTWTSDTLRGQQMSLSFPTVDTGYYVGWAGVIYKTTNFGNNWSCTSSPYGNLDLLINVLAIDDNNIIAIGNRGSMFKSTNTGLNWSYSKLTNYNLTSTFFINNQTGFIGSASAYPLDAKILKTVNSGNNWDTLSTGINGSINSIFFLDENVGFFTNTQLNNINKTTNAGITWTSFPISGSYPTNLGSVHFINSLTGFLFENFNGGGAHMPPSNTRIYKTTNQGVNWTQITYYDNTRTSSLKFIDENTGYAKIGGIMKTTNGGLNWTQILAGGDGSEVRTLGQNTVYSGSYKSTNGGTNWTLYNTKSESINSICYINENTGILVGGNGAGIMRTTDGGEIVSSVFSQQVSSQIPKDFSLSQNYPNPFNPSTKINYEIKSSGFVSLKVFDLLGKEVATLVNEKQNAGSYAVDFNSSKYNLPSGIYFYTLNAGEFKETKKMALVK